jgi:hypothetical protein
MFHKKEDKQLYFLLLIDLQQKSQNFQKPATFYNKKPCVCSIKKLLTTFLFCYRLIKNKKSSTTSIKI